MMAILIYAGYLENEKTSKKSDCFSVICSFETIFKTVFTSKKNSNKWFKMTISHQETINKGFKPITKTSVMILQIIFVSIKNCSCSKWFQINKKVEKMEFLIGCWRHRQKIHGWFVETSLWRLLRSRFVLTDRHEFICISFVPEKQESGNVSFRLKLSGTLAWLISVTEFSEPDRAAALTNHTKDLLEIKCISSTKHLILSCSQNTFWAYFLSDSIKKEKKPIDKQWTNFCSKNTILHLSLFVKC